MAFSDPGKGRVVLGSDRDTEPEKVTRSGYCECGEVMFFLNGRPDSTA